MQANSQQNGNEKIGWASVNTSGFGGGEQGQERIQTPLMEKDITKLNWKAFRKRTPGRLRTNFLDRTETDTANSRPQWSVCDT